MLRLVVIVSLLAGCRISLEDDGGPVGARRCQVNMTTPSCVNATGHAELSWIQANIFPSCTFSGCHNGSSTDLDLRNGMSYNELIDVSSVLDTSRKLVVPNDVMSSYLMFMLGDFPGDMATPPATLPSAGYMPQGGAALCCQKLDVLEAWISAGAPNN
jgi:hypothetical protein